MHSMNRPPVDEEAIEAASMERARELGVAYGRPQRQVNSAHEVARQAGPPEMADLLMCVESDKAVEDGLQRRSLLHRLRTHYLATGNASLVGCDPSDTFISLLYGPAGDSMESDSLSRDSEDFEAADITPDSVRFDPNVVVADSRHESRRFMRNGIVFEHAGTKRSVAALLDDDIVPKSDLAIRQDQAEHGLDQLDAFLADDVLDGEDGGKVFRYYSGGGLHPVDCLLHNPLSCRAAGLTIRMQKLMQLQNKVRDRSAALQQYVVQRAAQAAQAAGAAGVSKGTPERKPPVSVDAATTHLAPGHGRTAPPSDSTPVDASPSVGGLPPRLAARRLMKHDNLAVTTGQVVDVVSSARRQGGRRDSVGAEGVATLVPLAHQTHNVCGAAATEDRLNAKIAALTASILYHLSDIAEEQAVHDEDRRLARMGAARAAHDISGSDGESGLNAQHLLLHHCCAQTSFSTKRVRLFFL